MMLINDSSFSEEPVSADDHQLHHLMALEVSIDSKQTNHDPNRTLRQHYSSCQHYTSSYCTINTGTS
jgi:hypothetical protein